MPIEKEVKSASGRTKTIKSKKAVAVLAPEKRWEKDKPAKTAIRKHPSRCSSEEGCKNGKEVNIKISNA